MERMDPELKAKWIKALRSGEYQQAREALRSVTTGDTVAYCCLGVLCTMIAGIEWTADDALYRDKYNDTHDADGELPGPVKEIAGINHQAEIQLIGMNDGKDTRPHSFLEIADWIEKNL